VAEFVFSRLRLRLGKFDVSPHVSNKFGAERLCRALARRLDGGKTMRKGWISAALVAALTLPASRVGNLPMYRHFVCLKKSAFN